MEKVINLPVNKEMFEWMVDPKRPFSVRSLEPEFGVVVVDPGKCLEEYEKAAGDNCEEAKRYMQHPFGYHFLISIRDNHEAGVKAIIYYTE